MSNRTPPVALYILIMSVLLLSGCQHQRQVNRELVLNGYADSNYSKLNGNIGEFVCVRGKLTVSSMGLHFPLQPMEDKGILSPGYSRVVTDLSFDFARRNEILDGKIHTVCGKLLNSTPYQQCNDNWCRWYELAGAKLR